jgi:hypothetical protein
MRTSPMTMKRTKSDANSKKVKKLTLNKETLRDLTARGERVQGGVGGTARCAACTANPSGCN